MELPDPHTTIGAAVAAIGAFFGVRAYRRKDRAEESSTDVVVSLNGAARLLYEQFQAQMIALSKRVLELEQQVASWIALHRECENEKNILKLENESLKRGQK